MQKKIIIIAVIVVVLIAVIVGVIVGGQGNKALEGVYTSTGELLDVPMGTFINGVQTKLCTVKMPTDEDFLAIYEDANGQKQQATENLLDPPTLGEFYDSLGKNFANPYSWISIGDFRLEIEPKVDINELKSRYENVSNENQIGTPEHIANYFTRRYEDITTSTQKEQFIFLYQINEQNDLYFSYEITVDEDTEFNNLINEIGIDQFAQNVYNLITVS